MSAILGVGTPSGEDSLRRRLLIGGFSGHIGDNFCIAGIEEFILECNLVFLHRLLEKAGID